MSTAEEKPNVRPESQEESAYGRNNEIRNSLASSRRIQLRWSELSYSVKQGCKKEKKCILRSVHGACEAGELLAIMGPSGAGKSTLLNILSGYKIRSVLGTVRINGRERDLDRFRKLSCYITQDNCLLPHLSVMESMMVSAQLTLPSKISEADKKSTVLGILEDLGLLECVDTRALNLSGGERKRLSIALELINNPPVMFFDEPTSGLDSFTSIQCINILKELALGGRTVICSIHQPSATLFEKFDNLYMITDGRCTYYGKVANVIPYLKTMDLECLPYHNPADFIMEVAFNIYGEFNDRMTESVQNGKSEQWLRLVTEAAENKIMAAATIAVENMNCADRPDIKDVYIAVQDGDLNVERCTVESSLMEMNNKQVQVVSGYVVGFPKQFRVLFVRIFFSQLREPFLTLLRLIVYVSTGLLIGALYWEIGNNASKIISNSGCIFFSIVFLLFSSLMPTILTFPSESPVITREYLNGWYSLESYYLARTTADIPFQIFFTVIYSLIIYYFTSQPNDPWRFSMFLLISILVSFIGQSIGLLIGACVSSLEVGIFLGPVAIIPILLFSGFFIGVNAIPVYLKWVADISYIRYSFEGIALALFGYDRETLDCRDEEYCHFMDPTSYLEEIGFDGANIYADVGALLAFFAIARVLTLVVLHVKIYLSR